MKSVKNRMREGRKHHRCDALGPFCCKDRSQRTPNILSHQHCLPFPKYSPVILTLLHTCLLNRDVLSLPFLTLPHPYGDAVLLGEPHVQRSTCFPSLPVCWGGHGTHCWLAGSKWKLAGGWCVCGGWSEKASANRGPAWLMHSSFLLFLTLWQMFRDSHEKKANMIREQGWKEKEPEFQRYLLSILNQYLKSPITWLLGTWGKQIPG